jgi:hypothetical protein
MVSIPLPTFDNIRNLFNFWINQEDKWFYFETEKLKVASNRESEVHDPFHTNPLGSTDYRKESIFYRQDRIVGRISDVVPYPPSLLLQETSIFKVRLDVYQGTKELMEIETRKTYGLVFSQITYYEPIENWEVFIKSDIRVADVKFE